MNAQGINGEVKAGDYVIVCAANEVLSCLIGQVIAVGNPAEQESAAEGVSNNVHVNFKALSYPIYMRNDIAESLNESLYFDEYKHYEDLPIEDILLNPGDLINLTGLDDSAIDKLVSDYDFAEDFCETVVLYDLPVEIAYKRGTLLDRLDENLKDYHDILVESFGKREIIDMAHKAAAMSDAHSYMTEHHTYERSELDFLLQYKNPLEMVADEWQKRQGDISDVGYAFDYVTTREIDYLADYAFAANVDAQTGLRRFMDVDLYDFLGKIAGQVIIHYPNDWNIDKETLLELSKSNDPEDKRRMWHVCSYSTHLLSEREAFIKDTGAFNYWTDYRQNDPDMFGYFVEVIGFDGKTVRGNVFEAGNYAEHAKHVREAALELASVTLTYSDDWGVNAGKVLTVSRREYDDDRNRLMSKSGRVVDMCYHPADERELYKLRNHEQDKRLAYPIGSVDAHLHKIADTLAAVRKPPQQEQAANKPKPNQSLDEKLGAADKKVKAQEAHNKNISRNKREER